MKDENILDAPPNQEPPPKNKLPYAILASLFITIPLLLNTFFRLSDWTILIQYISVIAALYFFIKKTNPQPDVISFSAWGILVVFLGYTCSSFVHYTFIYESITYTYLELTLFTLGNLFKSLLIGYPLYLGVFLWIKKRNWAMLILMTFVSLIFLSMLFLDRSLGSI